MSIILKTDKLATFKAKMTMQNAVKQVLAPPALNYKKLTMAQLGRLSAADIGTYLFRPRTVANNPLKNAPIKGLGNTWSFYDRASYKHLLSALVEDEEKIVIFLRASAFSREHYSQMLRSIPYMDSTERKTYKRPEMQSALITYGAKYLKLSREDCDRIICAWPYAGKKYPGLVERSNKGYGHYLAWLKVNGSRYAYEKCLADLGPRMHTAIRDKATIREVLKNHPRLFKYITVDFVDNSVLNAKEFTYVFVRCKPKTISPDMISYLESTTFLHTITGDIVHTKRLRMALEKLKTTYAVEDPIVPDATDIVDAPTTD